MTRERPSAKRGVAGLWLLLCMLIGGVGLAFDFAGGSGLRFWVAAGPGFRALLGVGAALATIGAAHVLRLAVGRRIGGKRKRERR
jgi:hypothetical protein